ncbi:histidine ammonia-lyase [Burkholderia sp. Ch1-1]|nr:histidine ammonia-lyase [Burkholderia sp. Ch1-1]
MNKPDEVLTLVPGQVTLGQLRRIIEARPMVQIERASLERVEKSKDIVSRIVADGKIVYGVNTGFGRLANTTIPAERIAELQRNLVLSHSVGTGEPMEDHVVGLIMALKAISLARGHSGVRPQVVLAIISMLNAGVYPCIPSKGSVGASGDLAPLAHLAAAMLGVGHVRIDGKRMPAAEGLSVAGLEALELGPKEGLALLNGTQASTALALSGLFAAERVFASAMVTGTLSLEAVKGSTVPFDPRIHVARGQRGQIDVAGRLAALLDGSGIIASHGNGTRVQDPYSIRCQPQVMGACLDHIRYVAGILTIEANAASDNPLVFDNGDVLSGGNFHAEPIALAADALAVAISEIGAISERRTALLLDSHMSGLPAFLVKESGINSGFMIAQVTSAALASENKSLAHPASVDSLPTSANQEDHVSMATFAARRLKDMTDNTAVIVGIEGMAAAQGMDFHRPLRSSELLEEQHVQIRARVSFYTKDRYLADDIERMKNWALESSRPGIVNTLFDI